MVTILLVTTRLALTWVALLVAPLMINGPFSWILPICKKEAVKLPNPTKENTTITRFIYPISFGGPVPIQELLG
jgi:hypothetical protein